MSRLLLGVPVVVLIILAGLVLTPAMASCGDHSDLVKQAVLSCPRAKEILGDDAHAARLGCACGTTETEGNYGRASWSVPYTGSKGRATVEYDASEKAGTWQLDRATLHYEDQVVDLVACSGPKSPPPSATLAQTNADAVSVSFDGKVISSNHGTLDAGDACRGTLERARGGSTAHVTVSCDGVPGNIYDGTGSFTLDVRDSTKRDDDHIEFDDTRNTDTGTSGCRLSSSGNSGTLTLFAPSYEIVVQL